MAHDVGPPTQGAWNISSSETLAGSCVRLDASFATVAGHEGRAVMQRKANIHARRDSKLVEGQEEDIIKGCDTCPTSRWNLELMQYFAQYCLSALSWSMCSIFCITMKDDVLPILRHSNASLQQLVVGRQPLGLESLSLVGCHTLNSAVRQAEVSMHWAISRDDSPFANLACPAMHSATYYVRWPISSQASSLSFLRNLGTISEPWKDTLFV